MPKLVRVATVTQLHGDVSGSDWSVIRQHVSVPSYPLPDSWVVAHLDSGFLKLKLAKSLQPE